MAQVGRTRGLGLLFAMAALLAAAPAAGAATPNCGAVIKRDIRFNTNLNCTASGTPGLVIGRNGVEIDLNGKKLIGPDNTNVGILNTDGYHRLTIKNGALRGWVYGVHALNTSRFRALNLNITPGNNTGTGLYLQRAVQPVIRNVVIDDADTGIEMDDTVGQLIERVRVTGSDRQQTLGLLGEHQNGTVRNFRANGALYGVYVTGSTPSLKILNSTAHGAGQMGFFIGNALPLAQYRYILKGNAANNAASYGLYANFITLGGGNSATGAGAVNCRNVVC